MERLMIVFRILETKNKMKHKFSSLLLGFMCFSGTIVKSQDTTAKILKDTDHEKMVWFKEAKLGIFIHWGLYAVDGISESWSFYNEYLSHEDYLKQLSGFTAANFKPKEWAKLIKDSGAKYSVITSKHHDGFALWNTNYGHLNAVSHAAAKKDVLSPLIDALKEKELKVGIYFSLPDWSSDLYTHFTTSKRRYAIEQDPQRWQQYLNYMNGQLLELKNNYTPDLWWFDGDWEHPPEAWESTKIRTSLLKGAPNTIINSRLTGQGDYQTPEIGVPVYRPEAKYWELCMTLNDSWGYQQTDNNYKTSQQVIDIFVDCISKGGNLLLDIGPKADGSIDPIQKERLLELGSWIRKHHKAVYETEKGIPYEHFYGPTTLSKDKQTLFLFVRDIPKDGKIVVKGISNTIQRAYVVGNGSILSQNKIAKLYWNKYPGISYIDLPKETIDTYYTVVALVLDGPIELYSELNGAVEQN